VNEREQAVAGGGADAPSPAFNMEQKIEACRRNLKLDPINQKSFERRYRPDLDNLFSCALQFGRDMACLRRFTYKGKVYELVEFLIEGATDCVLLINFQTQKILEYARYIDAEATLVDQMQDAEENMGRIR
jgi:hypothetical protein